ncbi:MAG: ketopantoate reductase family protein [Acidobacteria bacterium]|nr:ketopantoate reductase family protein [Acidobacteriota bacterium]
MRHAILGPGGVGGLIAASLAYSGEAVTVIVRSDTAALYPDVIQLESSFGRFTVAVEHSSTVPAVDILWIAVKAIELEQALGSIPDSTAIAAILPLLNGIDHVALLRARYGSSRVIPATITVESERASRGHIVHRSPFARLNISAAGSPLLDSTINKLRELGFTCNFVDDEQTLLWSKLVFLAPLALATTAANKTTGEIAQDQALRRQLQDSVREACAVAQSEGAIVSPESVLSSINALPPGTRSSMQKDVDRGKLPELDAIAGPILRGAIRHHLQVPVIRKLQAEVEHRSRESLTKSSSHGSGDGQCD